MNRNPHRSQNAPASAADNRPKHHGSETRQTQQVAGRVKRPIKSEVARLAKLKGWTESRTVASLVEQALASNLAEQFGVMLKTTIQEAVTMQMQKENNRAGNLALEAFYSAEEARVLVVYLIRLFLGSDIDILPQIIKDLPGPGLRECLTGPPHREAHKLTNTRKKWQSSRLNIPETNRDQSPFSVFHPQSRQRTRKN